MKILYVFPHPDDESFGPAPAIAKQVREGHKVYLLTLTKGEATKQRLKLGVSKKEMGEIRYKEMLKVEKVLGLEEMRVLNFPDSGMKDLDTRELEKEILKHIEEIAPEVIVTYAVHGISGFEDHLVGHAVVKNAFIQAREKGISKRLALFTLTKEQSERGGTFPLKFSKEEDIDCAIEPNEEDKKKLIEALNCYETYKEVIENSNVKNVFGESIYFEFFQENYDHLAKDIFSDL